MLKPLHFEIGSWAEDFAQFTSPPTRIDPDEAAAFEKAFEEAENRKNGAKYRLEFAA